MSRIRTRRKSRTEVTIETDELLVMGGPFRSRAWCAACGLEVDVVPLAIADLLQGWHAVSEAHHLEVAGAVVVCINSLIRMR